MDAFSPLEISCLIRHGYCVGRKACRSRADLFGGELPTNPPWEPVPAASVPQNAPPDARSDGTKQDPAPSITGTDQDTTPSTIQARMLQSSAFRQIWGNLFHI